MPCPKFSEACGRSLVDVPTASCCLVVDWSHPLVPPGPMRLTMWSRHFVSVHSPVIQKNKLKYVPALYMCDGACVRLRVPSLSLSCSAARQARQRAS